ncbi:MAG: DUF1552 domain-containing protein [Myxococcales bacterium]|nr:MAG: DUF1552 domain-containing protein [Myxococcales bacterium]
MKRRSERLASRRAVLRGLGVALTLPWLESLAPRPLRAQNLELPRRFLPIFMPNGASEWWRPLAEGQGAKWQLSSVLEPFGALKNKLQILTGLENGSVFNVDGGPSVEPSHGRLAGAWLTCMDAAAERAKQGLAEVNGVSVDQLLASHLTAGGRTALPSLQVGLSTPLGGCDGEPCSNSRSVSWASATQPMYKKVDPLEIFEALVGVLHGTNGGGEDEARKRVARDKSVLDAVLESAQQTRQRLGSSDRLRLEEFLTSVRAVEQRATTVSASMGGRACFPHTPPEVARVEQASAAPRQTTATYEKGAHADAVSDLVAMAFECDVTRVVSYMLEDERSEFTYDHVEERAFSAESSKPKGGRCPEYHLAQHMAGDAFATITWWNVGKVAELCRKLDSIQEAPGVSALDSCVVLLGGCMQGGTHRADQLPIALVGGKNLGLSNDQHLVLDRRPLRDLYLTLLNDVFGADIASFGQDLTGAPHRRIAQLLNA